MGTSALPARRELLDSTKWFHFWGNTYRLHYGDAQADHKLRPWMYCFVPFSITVQKGLAAHQVTLVILNFGVTITRGSKFEPL